MSEEKYRKQRITEGFWMVMPKQENVGANFDLSKITFCKQTAYGVEEMEVELNNRDWENIGYCLRCHAGWTSKTPTDS